MAFLSPYKQMQGTPEIRPPPIPNKSIHYSLSSNDFPVYRVSQEERSVFWEVTVWVILAVVVLM
jgi:hypothetical protein